MDIGDELVEAYPKLKRFAVSYVRDVDRAEDLVMSAITKILEMANSSDIVNLEAYAITVVKNLVKDEIKRNRPEYGEVPEVPDYADPGGLLVIKDALSSLSDKCQEILELSAVGYSYSEMAGMLGIAEGTVASRKSQCLNDFKKNGMALMSDDHDPLEDGDLIAYLDGELTDAAKADLERRLQTDDSAQARLEELRVSSDLVRKLFDVDVPRTVSPKEEEKIRELVRQHQAAAQSENVVSFSSYRQRLRSGVRAVSTATGLNTLADGHGWQKIAASLVIGGFLGLTVGPQLALEPEVDGFASVPTNQNYVTRGVENEVLNQIGVLRRLEPQLYLINIENNKNYSPGDAIKTSEKYKISLEGFPAGPVEISFDDGLSPKMMIKKYDVKSRSDIINDIAISNIEGKYAIFEVSYLKGSENKYRLFIFGISGSNPTTENNN